MPVLVAVVGAVMTGFMYWLLWGKGLDYLEHRIGSAWAARRRARLRAESERRQALAPILSVDDPRDAAAILLLMAARARGTPTPEQMAAVEGEMRDVLGLGHDLPRRLAFAGFAAQAGASPDDAIDAFAPLLRKALTPAERDELLAMTARVAAVHGGPIAPQERILERLRAKLCQE